MKRVKELGPEWGEQPFEDPPDGYLLADSTEEFRAHLEAVGNGPVTEAAAVYVPLPPESLKAVQAITADGLPATVETDGEGLRISPTPVAEYDIGRPDQHDQEEQPDLTEYGMARLLIDTYGDRLRCVLDPEHWISCRGDGRWTDSGSYRFAQQAAARVLRRVLPEIFKKAEGDYRERLGKFMARQPSRSMVDAMLSLAKSEPELIISIDKLDTHPMLLACRNGIVDLETGTLRPHDPALFLTRGSPIAYDASAEAPRWQRFLREIFLDDEELIAYIRRVCGYALTGKTSEELLWILYGMGGNGKSKFTGAMRNVLGNQLATTADFSTFTLSKYEQIPADLARLDRARLVIASEKHQAKPLDEARIKQVTGGDPIVARYMRQNFFQFMAQFKLWLVVNQKPTINADMAIKRRVRMIPFEAEFLDDQAQQDLEEELAREAPGILAWAVEGAIEWAKSGIGECTAVQRATGEYMAEVNPLTDWVEARCILEPGSKTAGGDLRSDYESWCHEAGRPLLSTSDYGQSLVLFDGVRRTHSKRGAVWHGIRLKNDLFQGLTEAA